MRLLVTGGCGFIGSNFIRHILEHYSTEFVSNVDALTYAGNLANTADLAARYGDRYEFYQADIANAGQIDALMSKHKFYAVINFAGESNVDRSIESQEYFVHTNVDGTSVLLERARMHGIQRFVQISTDKVYGTARDAGAFSEEAALQPSSPYSASKASADLMVLSAFQTYRQETLITRCATSYGPYQHPEKFAPHVITCALQDKPVPIFGDGQSSRDFIHVCDHCSAIVAVLLEGMPGSVYNVGARSEHRMIDVAHFILDYLRKPRDLIQHTADRPGDDRRCAVDPSKLERELHWKPIHSFEESMRKTIDWYAANREWWQRLV